jgi:molecular chaperone GrpE
MAMTEEKDLEQEILENNPDTEPAEDDGVEIPIESEEEAGAETEAEAAAETETESGAETEEEAGKKKEGLFGKKKKKDKKDEQIEELNDKLKRQMAEFDNFRKRSEKEKSQMFDMGARTIIEKVLPVVDNFERGLAAVPEEQKEDAFVTGMDKVYRQLMTELDAIGVKAIEAVGQEFDPELHNAVMQVENEELESGTVAQELQKGYTYKETVVRHSMVAVVS